MNSDNEGRDQGQGDQVHEHRHSVPPGRRKLKNGLKQQIRELSRDREDAGYQQFRPKCREYAAKIRVALARQRQERCARAFHGRDPETTEAGSHHPNHNLIWCALDICNFTG